MPDASPAHRPGTSPHRSSTATRALLDDLLRRRSATPDDAGCQAILAERLRPLGFRCETIASNGVTNLWARRGDDAPLFVFAGHTDVVPTGPLDDWTSDPFVPTERDGHLYARGAADMKTSIAAFVVAAEEFVAAHPDALGSIALLITSDEEGPAVDGSARVCDALRARGERIDWCIVGEPTSDACFGDTIKNGRRGSLSGRLTVRGVQGHIAYPQLARNPIHDAARAVAALVDTEWDRGNADFPPTSFQVSNLNAGTGAGNVIPGRAQVDFNFRFSTERTADDLKAEVDGVLRRLDLDADVEWTVGGLPFLTPAGTLSAALAAAIERRTGVRPALSTTGGTSDGRFIARIAAQTVEFGPVNATIHKVDERVAVADIEPLKDIYRETLVALFARR